MLSFDPPRKLLPLYGFVHWLLDYFTSAAAAAAAPTLEAASLERPRAMVADTDTDTDTDTEAAAPPAPTAAAVDILVGRLRLVAQSRYAPSRQLPPPPPPSPLLQDCLTHAAFALLSSDHYYKLPQPQPHEIALSAFAPDEVRPPPGGFPATRRSATGRVETLTPTPPPRPPPPPVTSPPAASASGFGFYVPGGEGFGGGATIEGESPQQALRRIHATLSAAQATAARWARLPAVVRTWARQRGPAATPAAPDRAAAVEAVLAHAQLAALLLDPCTRLHDDVPPNAHVAAPLDILQLYESVFLASWEGVSGRDYFRRTCVPGYDVVAEWCKCVAWLVDCTPSVLHRPEHMRGPGGYESAGEERIHRVEAAQLASEALNACLAGQRPESAPGHRLPSGGVEARLPSWQGVGYLKAQGAPPPGRPQRCRAARPSALKVLILPPRAGRRASPAPSRPAP